MKRLKRCNKTLDRLSELPDSLIQEILSFLDMREVVTTSLLSKRWKYLWITIPCLRFCEYGNNSARIVDFINRSLSRWKGGKLRRLEITVRSSVTVSSHGDMDLWLLFAKERNVEDVCILLHNPSLEFPVYRASQCLYECSRLEKLMISYCHLPIPSNLQWDQLKTLMIHEYRGDEGVIDHLVSHAPQLQTVKLHFARTNQDLIIRSSSLKLLHINSAECDPLRRTVFTIWAPKLETLEISGAPPSKCVLTDVSSLISATLNVPAKWGAQLVTETLTQFLPAIQHVPRVTLSACCFKMIGVMKGKCSFSPFKKTTKLTINGGPIDPLEICGLVEHFPSLIELVVDWKHDIGELLNIAAIVYEEDNLLNSFLLQLRTVKITWYSYDASMFQFIEILLKCAPAIQKMVLERGGGIGSENMFMAAQKMVSLQRSFPNVELVLSKKNHHLHNVHFG